MARILFFVLGQLLAKTIVFAKVWSALDILPIVGGIHIWSRCC